MSSMSFRRNPTGNYENSRKRVYLDTSYLYQIVMKRFTKKSDDFSRQVEQSIYNAERQNYQIVIPQIAVGEIFAKLPKHIKGQQDLINMLNSLWTSLEKLLNKEFSGLLPIMYKGIDIVQRIKEYENRLEPTDIVIIAQAASDPCSDALLTLDKKITESKGLREFINELMNDGERTAPLRFLECL